MKLIGVHPAALMSRLASSVVAAGLGLSSGGAAWADSAALLRCRQLPQPEERFRCYEAIPVPQGEQSPPPKAAQIPAPTAQFGLERQAPQPEVVDKIESRINGRFYGWRPNDSITLANGQVWRVTDDSIGALNATDPAVTVRRGALGAFYLEIEGTNRSPRVRRVR